MRVYHTWGREHIRCHQSYNAIMCLFHSILQGGKHTINLDSVKNARQTLTHVASAAQRQSVRMQLRLIVNSAHISFRGPWPAGLSRNLSSLFFASSRISVHDVMKRICVDTESAPRSRIMLWVCPGTGVVNLETAFEGQRWGGQATVRQHTCSSSHNVAEHLLTFIRQSNMIQI